MKSYLLVMIIVLPVVTSIAVMIYLFGSQINNALGSEIADKILLIILILVDGFGGVLVPFLSIDQNVERELVKN
jgi:hypothetical protein